MTHNNAPTNTPTKTVTSQTITELPHTEETTPTSQTIATPSNPQTKAAH